MFRTVTKMSKLAKELRDFAFKGPQGGSHDTRRERALHVERFAKFLQEQNIQIRTASQIKTKYVEAYIKAGLESGKSKRSLQNEMASIRAVLRAAGRDKLADSDALSNKSLGLAGASRAGTNRAMTYHEYQTARAELEAKGSLGEAAAFELMYTLGLRSKEAVMSSKSLTDWQRQLSEGQAVRVLYGTKGGRPRDVNPANRAAALEAVKAAQRIASQQGGRLIIGKGSTLESARNRLDNQMRSVLSKLNLSAHSERYAFAQAQVDYYMSQGYQRREALAQASMDLGHGSSRYKYIRRVYDQRSRT